MLYAAWASQFLTNGLLGGYVSALIGATVMTVVSVVVSRLPTAMPAHASFLPGFWLLVPGALGLIGLTELAGGGGGQDVVATIGSIFAIALGVLCGTQLIAWAVVTGRVVTDVAGPRRRTSSVAAAPTNTDEDRRVAGPRRSCSSVIWLRAPRIHVVTRTVSTCAPAQPPRVRH